MNFDQILIKFDQTLTIYVKNHQIHVEHFQGRHFLRKKTPAGMPTHRTGVDNIKIHQNQLESIKNIENQSKSIKNDQNQLKMLKIK